MARRGSPTAFPAVSADDVRRASKDRDQMISIGVPIGISLAS